MFSTNSLLSNVELLPVELQNKIATYLDNKHYLYFLKYNRALYKYIGNTDFKQRKSSVINNLYLAISYKDIYFIAYHASLPDGIEIIRNMYNNNLGYLLSCERDDKWHLSLLMLLDVDICEYILNYYGHFLLNNRLTILDKLISMTKPDIYNYDLYKLYSILSTLISDKNFRAIEFMCDKMININKIFDIVDLKLFSSFLYKIINSDIVIYNYMKSTINYREFIKKIRLFIYNKFGNIEVCEKYEYVEKIKKDDVIKFLNISDVELNIYAINYIRFVQVRT